MRILIATAGVLPSEPVADFIASITTEPSAVFVVTVIEVPRSFLDEIHAEHWHPLIGSEPDRSDDEDEVIARYVEERGTRITEPVLAALRNRGIEAEGVYLEGEDPAETIIATARDLDIDLVVLGATKRLFDDALWESVTARVIRDSSVAVLVVPAAQPDDTGELDLPTSEIEIV